jgi:hypothetical protein
LFGDVVRKYTEKSRKRTKASEKKAGKAKVMGKNDTKLFTLAQRRKSYNKNIPKKAEKQRHMKEYRREKKVLGVNPELKEKNTANRKKSRAYQKFAEIHNKFYNSKKDTVPASLKMKETKIFFGKATRNYFVAVERLKTLEQDIYYEGNALGKMHDGTFQEITDKDMQRSVWTAFKLLGANEHARRANSVDLGSGLGNPSLFFSQLYFEEGWHFGIEFDKGLALTANGNLKRVTTKGVVNVTAGHFEEDNIKENGELSHVQPPHVALVHGDIQQIEHYSGFDIVYSFDAVHITEVKLAMKNAWNHTLSKNCKLFITNSSLKEVEELGYQDLQLVKETRVTFSKMNNGCESRPCYFYLQESLKMKSKNKWTFGSESSDAHMKTTMMENDSDPFQEVWKIFHEGGHGMMNWNIINHNMNHPDGQNFIERNEKSNRIIKVDYNEKRQRQKVWNAAALLNKRNG